jgi:hypothetical protein
MNFVPRSISVQFLQPEFPAVRWRRAILALLVPVPEAAVDEDHGFVFRQDDIRFTGQIVDVQPKPVAHPMQQPPDDKLRGRVFPADSPHVPRAPFFC